MIGLDTNVLVRYLTHDDPRQTAAAQRIIQSLTREAPGFVTVIVMVELIWVLQASYGFEKKEVERVLETLLRSKDLVIEKAESVSQALLAFKTGRADFSDYVIERIGHAANCRYTVTFDQKAATMAGMRLLE
jgi:predicted nucleic-acid-binding protein